MDFVSFNLELLVSVHVLQLGVGFPEGFLNVVETLFGYESFYEIGGLKEVDDEYLSVVISDAEAEVVSACRQSNLVPVLLYIGLLNDGLGVVFDREIEILLLVARDNELNLVLGSTLHFEAALLIWVQLNSDGVGYVEDC